MSARGLTGGRPRGHLNARDLNREVTIQSVTLTPDGGGGYTETLVDVATVPAHIEPLIGREQLLGMQTGMERPHRFTIRHREGVTGATRLLYDGRTFDIKSVVDTEERHRELILLAEEIV